MRAILRTMIVLTYLIMLALPWAMFYSTGLRVFVPIGVLFVGIALMMLPTAVADWTR